MVLEVTDSNFDAEIKNSAIPVLVDFWAPWCGPCRASSPHVDRISTELAGKVKVVKVNTDENSEIPARFGISAIPTFMVFKAGDASQPVARKTQMMDFGALMTLLKPVIG
ncbi:MAG: thioredoxin [Planctomycetes bacterium]|nr:thioredoxin [Planctomycetota bacterium]